MYAQVILHPLSLSPTSMTCGPHLLHVFSLFQSSLARKGDHIVSSSWLLLAGCSVLAPPHLPVQWSIAPPAVSPPLAFTSAFIPLHCIAPFMARRLPLALPLPYRSVCPRAGPRRATRPTKRRPGTPAASPTAEPVQPRRDST
jgi:hypothetical protein